MIEDLAAIFRQLRSPLAVAESPDVFDARPIPSRPRWRIAKNEAGFPAFLIDVQVARRPDRPPAVRLANLRVEHNVKCEVVREDGDLASHRYSIIQCLSADNDVQETFLRTMRGALAGLSGRVEAQDLVELIDQLVLLFGLIAQPRTRALQGLWGELFVILAANEPAVMIGAWHDQTMEHCDFGHGGERLEVKTSSRRVRDHMFSFEQVHPPSDVSVLVASLFVEEQTNGLSLGELWDRVVDEAGTGDGRVKIERVCAQTLGADLSVGRAFCADWSLAVDSLAFYDVESIPRPSYPCPPGVSQLRFRSDLSLADPIEKGQSLGEFHKCCVGKLD